jgi:type II secretory pathway pseudopilin PulG
MRSSREGVTLVELLITMGVLAIIGLAIVIVWFNAQRAHDTASAFASAQSEARIAMQTLEREVRSGSRASFSVPGDLEPDDPDPDEPPTFTFTELDFDTLPPNSEDFVSVRYFVEDGQLLRTANGDTRTLARNVTNFELTHAGGGSIAIALGIEVENRRAELRTHVAFRNP